MLLPDGERILYLTDSGHNIREVVVLLVRQVLKQIDYLIRSFSVFGVVYKVTFVTGEFNSS